MQDRLFVNGFEIDLDPQKPGGYTINGIDISDVTVQRSNYSSKLKIPATPQNLQKLGNPEAIASEEKSCYKLLPCSYEIQGFQIVPSGVLRIEDITDEIQATVFSGESALFKVLKTLKLPQISGLAAFNHFWNMEEVEEYSASAAVDNAPLYAAINYKLVLAAGGEWNYNFMFPSWYAYDLLNLMLQDQGFQIDTAANAWADSFFTNLIIPFTNKLFKNGEAYIEEHTFRANSGGIITVVNFDYENTSGSLENVNEIQAIDIASEATSNPNYSASGFEEPNASKILYHAEFRVASFSYSIVDNPPADPPSAVHYIAILKDGAIIASEQIGVGASLPLGTYKIEVEVQASQGEDIQVAFVSAIESLALGDEVEVDATIEDALFYTQSVEEEIFPEGWVDVANQLPEIKQSEFLRTLGTITASYIVADPISKRWTMKPFSEIVKRKGQAIDWNSKLVRKEGQPFWYISKETRPSGFFQESRFEWVEDETVLKGLGNGSFSLENEALDKSGDIASNVFAATESRLISGKVSAFLDKYDEDLKPVELEPRLLILDPLDVGFSITLTDAPSGGATGPVITPYVANFALESASATNGGLAWDNDLEARYWKELKESLSDFVEIEVYLKLTAADVSQVIEQYQKTAEDIVPIYLQGFYWVIKQIKQFRAKDFTRVVLTKIV